MPSAHTHTTYALDGLAHHLMGQAVMGMLGRAEKPQIVQRLELLFEQRSCILPYTLRLVSGNWGQEEYLDLPLSLAPAFYLRHTLWEPMPAGERRWMRLEPPLRQFRERHGLPEEAMSWMDGYELPLAILRMETILATRQLPLLLQELGIEVSPRLEIAMNMGGQTTAANGEGYLALIHRLMSQELWREELRQELSSLCYAYPLRQDWLYHLAVQPAMSSLHMVTEKLGQLHAQNLRQLLREVKRPVTWGNSSPVARTRGAVQK